MGGRVWVEDDEGKFPAEVTMRKKVRPLIGMWHDIHDKPITLDGRRFHQLEPHEGHMWALAPPRKLSSTFALNLPLASTVLDFHLRQILPVA